MENLVSKLSDMDERSMSAVLDGTSFAIDIAKKDKNLYDQVKEGKQLVLTSGQELDMKIISALDKLGYPMDELGTYIYKELISTLYDKIQHLDRKDIDEAMKIVEELDNAYSNLYWTEAREYLEMSVKKYHLYIEQAIDNIDVDKIDNKFASKVFGKNPAELNYGRSAFQIASYIASKYMIKYNNVKVKKLSNNK